eukprot:2411036-Prymnesium_polylepis.1
MRISLARGYEGINLEAEANKLRAAAEGENGADGSNHPSTWDPAAPSEPEAGVATDLMGRDSLLQELHYGRAATNEEGEVKKFSFPASVPAVVRG